MADRDKTRGCCRACLASVIFARLRRSRRSLRMGLRNLPLGPLAAASIWLNTVSGVLRADGTQEFHYWDLRSTCSAPGLLTRKAVMLPLPSNPLETRQKVVSRRFGWAAAEMTLGP